MSLDRRSVILASGAAVGLAAAAATILGASPALPPGAVAQVNGVAIERDALDRVLAAGIEKKRAIGMLVDQEILVQRGLEVGLSNNEPNVRDAIVAALMSQLQAETLSQPADDRALEDYYAAHRDRYRIGARVQAADLIARNEAEAEAARLQLGKGAPLPAGLKFGPLDHDTPQPRERAASILGPELASWLDTLEPGRSSPPVPLADGVHLIVVVSREAALTLDFPSARVLVAADFDAERLSRAQADYLDYLRRRARISVVP